MVHLHKKNLETLMKSRNEFTTNEEYNEYLRIYFAGLAMQGFISSPNTYETDGKEIRTQTEIAIFAVDMADELLKQLNWEHGNTNKV